MLVLTRRLGEEIVILGNITVSVEAIEGNRVRIGVRAPTDIPVDRKEIHDLRKAFARPPSRKQPNAQ